MTRAGACAHCGRPFDATPKAGRRLYCSTSCKDRAKRRRELAGLTTSTAATRMAAWRERKRAEGYRFVKGRPVYRGDATVRPPLTGEGP